MLVREYFNQRVFLKQYNRMQTEKIREELIKNLDRKGIRTSFVQIDVNSKSLMIRLNIERNAV